MISIQNLSKDYSLKTGFVDQLLGKSKSVSALNDVSLDIADGEVIGLVGESGCGKTTLGKLLLKIEDITSGKIIIDDMDISKIKGKSIIDYRKNVQMIFQDPYDSLDPKMTIFEIIAEPLKSLKLIKDESGLEERIKNILKMVGLVPAEDYMTRYPHRLSGGQRQRVAIARALIVNPKYIVADEPVSMLDVSIRAGILNLLQNLNSEHGISILLITHDLATARFLCNRIVVMYLGKIVELLPTEKLMTESRHPYTKLLLSSAPDLFSEAEDRIDVKGEAANATAVPKGCRFWPRCIYAEEKCKAQDQILERVGDGHYIACWKHEELEFKEILKDSY